MARLYVIVHSRDCSIGSTKSWIKWHYLHYTVVDASTVSSWPRPKSGDLLIVLGGDMEAWEIDKYPWLLAEKAFIRECIELKACVFGICLGAQLLAEQLGSKVISTDDWQIGWHKVTLEERSKRIGVLKPFHFHRSTFDIPPGARRVAVSELFPNQGFRLGRHRGYQFHTEIDLERMLAIVRKWRTGERGQVQSRWRFICDSLWLLWPLRTFYHRELTEWVRESGSMESWLRSDRCM